MSQPDSSHPLPISSAPAAVPHPDAESAGRTDPPAGDGHAADSRLRIAVPVDGLPPSFDNVYALAVTGAFLDQEVLVICLTDETLAGWRRRLEERGRPLDGLALVDGQFGWSADWRAFFCQRSYDVIVLHGIHTALKEQRIPPAYTRRLMDAVPRGLIVLA